MPRVDNPVRYTRYTEPSDPGRSFEERVEQHFDEWDQNGDGTLAPAEIDQAMQDPRYQGDDGAALATLKTHGGALKELANDEWGEENDGVSREDLSVYRGVRASGLDVNGLAATDLAFQSRIQTATHELFATPGIDPQALEQGSRGDCWFLASAVAEIRRDPQDFRSRFRELPEGGYTVRFEGHDPVYVDPPTDAELAYGARSGQDGSWGTVLEKAAGQLESRDRLYGGPTHPADEIDGGRTDAEGIAFFTGAPTDYIPVAGAPARTFRDRLEQSLEDDKLVVASAKVKASAIPGDHAYTVLAYDRASDSVTLRNPWGRGETKDPTGAPRDGQNDGVFSMTLAEFSANFAGFTVER